MNQSYLNSVEKNNDVCRIPNIINRIMFFKQEFIVDHLKYNWDTSVLLFLCCLQSVIWLDVLKSQGTSYKHQGVSESKWIRHLVIKDADKTGDH